VTQETVDAYLREAQRFGTLRAYRDRMVDAMDDEGMRSWNVSIDAHNKTSNWSTRICTPRRARQVRRPPLPEIGRGVNVAVVVIRTFTANGWRIRLSESPGARSRLLAGCCAGPEGRHRTGLSVFAIM
jgi:hypothetical protein